MEIKIAEIKKYQPEVKTVDDFTYIKIGNIVTVTGYAVGRFSALKKITTMPYRVLKDTLVLAMFYDDGECPPSQGESTPMVWVDEKGRDIVYRGGREISGLLLLNFSFITDSAYA